MSLKQEPKEHPPLLPFGTRVGDWSVVERHGRGAYGEVYRAVRIGQEDAGPVALKVSVYPWDQRFVREAELLARLSHPGVPRLLGRGVLRHVSGVEHPWLAMEWVEGTPLYAWAQRHAPTSEQVARVLAQVARGLEAVHAANAVHRDVKGDNVLVREADGQAVLIDFGSGHYQGATRLTWQALPPSTLEYHSAQASLFYLGLVRNRDAYYAPTPADDAYALGVTAYRLVMGEYPPPMEPHQDEEDNWHVTSADPRPLLEGNARVAPRLRELIVRMLSASPQERGTMAELAEALESAAVPQPRPEASAEKTESPEPHVPKQAQWFWPALVAAGAAALLLWPARPAPQHVSASGPGSSAYQAPDAGPAAVGDTSPTVPPASAETPLEQKPIAQAPRFQPRPEQARPDEKGNCPGPKQVVINGACWVELRTPDAADCTGNGYDFQDGKCYVPAPPARRQPRPTSSPPEGR